MLLDEEFIAFDGEDVRELADKYELTEAEVNKLTGQLYNNILLAQKQGALGAIEYREALRILEKTFSAFSGFDVELKTEFMDGETWLRYSFEMDIPQYFADREMVSYSPEIKSGSCMPWELEEEVKKKLGH